MCQTFFHACNTHLYGIHSVLLQIQISLGKEELYLLNPSVDLVQGVSGAAL